MKSTFSPKKTYQSILFIAGADIRSQKKAFDKFSRAISQKSSTKLISVYDLFFPKRDYTKKEIIKIMRENAIDAVLVVNLGNQKAVDSGFLLPVFETTTGSTSGNVSGRVGQSRVDLDTYQTTSQTTESSVWVPYKIFYTQSDVSLYDFSKGEIVWTASADTQSLDLDSIIGSVVQRGARELIKSGLLTPRITTRDLN